MDIHSLIQLTFTGYHLSARQRGHQIQREGDIHGNSVAGSVKMFPGRTEDLLCPACLGRQSKLYYKAHATKLTIIAASGAWPDWKTCNETSEVM